MTAEEQEAAREAMAQRMRRLGETVLATWEGKYRAGNQAAPLEAIYWCFQFGLPVPSWATEAIAQAVGRVRVRHELRSWDDAFGKAHPPSTNLHAENQKHKNCVDVYLRVLELRRKRPKPRDVFDKVATETGLERPTVKRYFDEMRKMVAEYAQ